MARDMKEERLKAIPLFRNADHTALSHLTSAVDEVSVAPGRVLIRQDHNHNEIFVIASGTASVEVDGEVVAEIPAGEVIGELGFFVQAPASATVKAKTPMDLLVIPYNRFNQILDDNPRLTRDIARELAERLYATDAKLN